MKKIAAVLLSSIFSFVLCEGISGVSYFEYRNGDTNQISGVTGDSGTHGFYMTRAYLSYDTKLSENISFKFQSDMQNKIKSDSDEVQVEGQAYYMYIKNAKLDVKMGDGAKITVGLQGMNMFNVQEKTWGHRFVAKSAMDANEWSSAADMGIGIFQSFGDISASLLYTNGEGYKNVSRDNNMKISAQAVYGEKRLDKNDGLNAGVVYSTLKSNDLADDVTTTNAVTGVFGGWAGMGTRLGFEYNMSNTSSSPDGMYDDKQTLMSFYANYQLMDNLSVMVRYDNLEPDGDVENDEETSIIAGIVWKVADGFTVSPNMVQTKIASESEDEFILNFQMKF